MTGGTKRKRRFDPRSEANKLFKAGRHLIELAGQISEDLMPVVDSSASGSVVSEGDTILDETEDEAEAQRRPKHVNLEGKYLQGIVEDMLQKGNLSAAPKLQGLVEAESNVPPTSSTQPPPLPWCPPRPKNCKNVEEWSRYFKECKRVKKIHAKALASSDSVPTLRALEDGIYNDAVQDWRSKRVVLAAARSVVNITPIPDGGGPTGTQCTGFILRRYEHSGVVFSVIVTCSAVVCKQGRLLDPVPKLSVRLPDRKTVMEAHLLYFNDHFDIAFLLLSSELSLDVPRFGCCPDYNQKVFVLGKDNDASLAVNHGVISWTEESDFIGRDYYMFLDGKVPQGGTGGPVIDHDGLFRGMAFKLSPKPAVLSISTILTCSAMFMHFGRIARPMLGLNLRTVASVDVDILEDLSEQNINSGYIVEMVRCGTPAQKCEICKGDVILSINGPKILSLPQLEDYLLSLGWRHLTNSDPTTDLKEAEELSESD